MIDLLFVFFFKHVIRELNGSINLRVLESGGYIYTYIILYVSDEDKIKREPSATYTRDG